jgi:hypothetical protein
MTWSPSDSDNPTPAYGGKAVRIRCYWTRALYNWDYEKKPVGSAMTAQIHEAGKILTRYSLGLDVDRSPEYDLDYYDPINPKGDSESLFKLRDLIDRGRPAVRGKSAGVSPPPENRLIVVFTPLPEDYAGWTFCNAAWLPWVVVDPRPSSSPSTLMHEMGHACRLGHYDYSYMQPSGSGATGFFNFQVHEIYRSYWCTGPRPQDWWDQRNTNINSSAFNWPPHNTPTP